MTRTQRLVIGLLATIALLVLLGAGCAFTFLFIPGNDAATAAEVVGAAQPAAAATPSPTTPPTSTVTPEPSQTPQPTATGTRVVIVTVLPTITPTRANCIDQISDFQASQLLTNEEVQQYLRQTIPLPHLDHCRSIRYIHKLAAVHGREISGNFIPIYREIEVYLTAPGFQNRDGLLDTLVHEIGHNVHFNMRRAGFDLDEQWTKLHTQSQQLFKQTGMGFVSDYARVNRYEDFAESYLAYVRYPQALQHYNPEKYEFMRRNIFEGQEYVAR